MTWMADVHLDEEVLNSTDTLSDGRYLGKVCRCLSSAPSNDKVRSMSDRADCLD
jgi:hypothetical protein